MTGSPAAARRRGCFFHGCLVGAVGLLLMLGGLLVALHYTWKTMLRFTDSQPAELPAALLSRSEKNQLKRRCAAFEAALREQRPAPALTLSADEINALIADDPRLQGFKGKVYVRLAGGQLQSQLSVPLEEAGWPQLKGRYLNGTATFRLSFQNGALAIRPQTIRVKGRPLPEIYMRAIRKWNLAAEAARQPQVGALLQELADIRVRDSQLTLEPQRKP